MSVRNRVGVALCSLAILCVCAVAGASLLSGCGDDESDTPGTPGKPADTEKCTTDDPTCVPVGD